MSELRVDGLMLGQRLRHIRREKGLTLAELGELVGKPGPYLSQVETGKLEPRLSLLDKLAIALGTTVSELLAAEAPSRRSQLEIALERAQSEPLYQSLRLPYLKASAKVPDDVLEHVVSLYRQLSRRSQVQAASPEGARKANAEMRVQMGARDNYFADIEALARDALTSIGWDGSRALSERNVLDIAGHFGFGIKRARDLPAQTRQVTDLESRTIYIPQRNAMATRDARSVILQTLGRFALGHEEPTSYIEYLQQRVQANYFAGAILAPEDAVVPFLNDAKSRRDLSIEDLKEVCYISYEMAAHRFTNLATRHLGLRVHFLRADASGVIWKAYENNGVPFPSDSEGAIEGQRACRFWGTRTAFHADDVYDIHYQFTETPSGTFWSSTFVEADRVEHDAISVGVRETDARWFRGGSTTTRRVSRCPDESCCRQPDGPAASRWAGLAWPSPRQHSHVLSAFPIGAFPGVDLGDVYDFLDRRSEIAQN